MPLIGTEQGSGLSPGRPQRLRDPVAGEAGKRRHHLMAQITASISTVRGPRSEVPRQVHRLHLDGAHKARAAAFVPAKPVLRCATQWYDSVALPDRPHAECEAL